MNRISQCSIVAIYILLTSYVVSQEQPFNAQELQTYIAQGHVEALKQHVKRGGGFNLYFNDKTLLSYAVIERDHDVIKYMLSNGADINLPDKDNGRNYTPIFYAVMGKDLSTTKLLKESGAKLDATCLPLGDTVLYFAKFTKNRDGSYGNKEMIEYLKGEGLTKTRGEPPEVKRSIPEDIRHAIAHRDHKRLRLLMKQGIDPNTMLADTISALEVAAFEPDAESLKILIDHGAILNDEGDGSLIFAIESTTKDNDKFEAVRMLIKHGADVNHLFEGKRPLDEALENGNKKLIKFLEEKGAKLATAAEKEAYRKKWNKPPDHQLASLISKGDIDQVKFYFEHGGNADPGALHLAAFLGKVDILKYLLDNGYDANQEVESQTPLSFLSQSKSNKMDTILQILLDAGADPGWTGKNGQSIFEMFCKPAMGRRSDREERMMADERGHAYMKAHMRSIEILKERLGVDTVGVRTRNGIKQVDIPTTYGLRTEDIPVKNNTASTTMTTPTTPTITPVP